MIKIFESNTDNTSTEIVVTTYNLKHYQSEIIQAVEKFLPQHIKGSANGVKRGYITPDGKFLDTFDKPHYAFEKNVVFTLAENTRLCLTGISHFWESSDNLFDLMGCIRINGSYENFICLPECKITLMQQDSLEEWLDYYFYTLGKLEIKVTTADGKQVRYNKKEYEPEEIIQKINRYYNSGILHENKIIMVGKKK